MTTIVAPHRASEPALSSHLVGETALLDAFARFLRVDVANGDATPDTIAAYKREVAAWVKWCAAQNLDPACARRSDVEAYREGMKAAGLSVATRARKLSIVRRFYEAAVSHGLMANNPAERVRAGKDRTAPEDKIKALSHPALAALIGGVPADTLDGLRDRAALGLMALHGLRRVEVHRLDHSALQQSGDEALLCVEGKGHKLRRVYLRADTCAALLAYSEAKAAVGLPGEGAFFVAHGNRSRGQRLSRRALNVIADKHLGAASLKREGMSCHALRHTFGTLSVAGGAKLEHVRDALGHSKLETTGIYVRAVERARHNPAHFIEVSL